MLGVLADVRGCWRRCGMVAAESHLLFVDVNDTGSLVSIDDIE